MPNPKAELSIPAVSLTVGEQTLKGSYVGSCVPVRDIPRFAAMMQSGKLPIEKLMTHTISLDEINEGFERLAAGDAIRQVIVF
ncbi:S-(hydroxymethyl)mycothiol dehydrogenase [compost metagenome]